MLKRLIIISLENKIMVLLATATMALFGLFALFQLPIGAVPDVTTNQVQVITTSRNLSTTDVERFITRPVELEMANLPGLVELRSVSKFGLSVVTVVFDDRIGTYLPRQLIAERLQAAVENIPQGFGTPFMGPISTGLGEIYQYVLEVDSAYRHLYSPSDLRTIQDWIVKRQLSGIAGVVEVNTWGGLLKQFEVAVDPSKLKATGLSINEVFEALERNNSLAGAGYIEKNQQAYFIRSEGLIDNLDELKQVVVARKGGLIIRVNDVAEIREGSATRFGAITANGEGEKVLGQVMMLKGSNSNEVISAVKDRVKQISGNLPPGIKINGFLERSKLIQKTTATIAENLILGFLIVMFVVVLLIGNWRSGLLVASVIPLSLLFAISAMYLFRIDANLMSLGAIDFGIIIDGTVIIVEYVAFQISRSAADLGLLSGNALKLRMDDITRDATQKLSRSALFGQLIIIIVFIPILSLTGIEGKMFRPMAQVFVAALVGAMILGFTYVPVMSSLFLKPGGGQHSLARRFVALLNKAYEPSVQWALNHKKLVVGAAAILLLATGFLFSRLGAEFVPTLDEGDFVIQPVFKTGTTLSETIVLTSKIETILKRFPEVDQVVSRIGAAEVPTDPMSMEECDIIITLKPSKSWVTATTKDGLADAFKQALSVLPGVEIEFTQPIEMRFNELITGTRADVAVKIFGEDLDMLNSLAQRIKLLVEGVDGIGDIVVEKTTGLPEYLVRINRTGLAQYGLKADEVNKVVSIAFAGLKAGEILDGERRFDLVLRYDKPFRINDVDLVNVQIPLPTGGSVPLSEVAEIIRSYGPAKISRDNARRRVVVGINVRGRDMESVVKDIQQRVASAVSLPDGYSIEYGGQFENLRKARQRLLIAIPVALVLIFIMLHLAFGKLSDALLIYTAIPMAVVGGVWLLWFRGMPFSISAGVGFIALFGIAVLNGIVLIEHYHALSHKGISDLRTIIVRGATERMRPVLLTATAAALGFLPMAVSQSAGAEVQRPLATVVIGGLFTSTFLTLIVMPVLYCIVSRRRWSRLSMPATLIAIVLLLSHNTISAQTSGADHFVSMAFENNQSVKAAEKQLEAVKASLPMVWLTDKTDIYFSRDNNNFAPNNLPLNVWGVAQNINWPGLYAARLHLARSGIEKYKLLLQKTRSKLEYEVRLAYLDLQYQQTLTALYHRLVANEARMSEAVERQNAQGHLTRLDVMLAKTSLNEMQLLLNEAKSNEAQASNRLAALAGATVVGSRADSLLPLPLPDTNRPDMLWQGLAENVMMQNKWLAKTEFRQWLPGFNAEYFSGTNKLLSPSRIDGFRLGVNIPLVVFPAAALHKTNQIGQQALQHRIEQAYSLRQLQRSECLRKLTTTHARLQQLQNQGIELAMKLEAAARKAYAEGQLDLATYLMSISRSLSINKTYFDAVYHYNISVLEFEFLPFNNILNEP
jgi:cobalt-zinc-cadmium resistance protein CzcA